jgi:hypothetical protein
VKLAVVLLVAAAACRGTTGPSSPAADGVRAYISALRSNDPHDAYRLLASDERKRISFDEFTLQWKQRQPERELQAAKLEEALRGNPSVGERAVIAFNDGKVVQLEREDKMWRLESELVTKSRAKRPRDAIRIFADAIHQRDVSAALRILTQRRREGLTRQIEGFIAGIGKHVNGSIEEHADRAELKWDENGIRYRIVLRREDDEWRIDDIYIRPAPKSDEDEKTIEGATPDVDF